MLENSNTNLNFNDLLTEVSIVWNHGFMGVDIGKIIIALIVFSVFLIFRGLITRILTSKIKLIVEKTKSNLDDLILDAITPPLKFIPIIMGTYFAFQILKLEDELKGISSNIIRTMIVFMIFWSLHRTIDPIRSVSKKLDDLLTHTMTLWIFKAIKVAIIFIGAAVILEIWGIAIGPLLAGLGLFGAAVALGAQDLFKNLIGGFTIMAEKRFNTGDWIAVDGVVEGIVEEIGFRSTRLRRFDKAPVYVPNSDLSDAVVTNFTRMTSRRIFWKIGVTYSTTTDQLKIIRDSILEYITNHEDFSQPPEHPFYVRVDSFNDSSIDIVVSCFTKSIDIGPYLSVKEELAFEIKDIVEKKAKSGFAFPSQSIYIESIGEPIEKIIKGTN